MMKVYARLYQFIIRLVMPFLPWREPEILKSYEEVINIISKENKKRVVLITDKGIAKLGLHLPLVVALKEHNIDVEIFDKVEPNPTIKVSEEALATYLNFKGNLLIGFGGGSAMDVTKIVAARVVRPHKTIEKMRGIIKVRRKTPPIIAIPTTSGTGSEATLAAVIIDEKTNHKYAVNDPVLIPHYALLMPELTFGLPPSLTAFTGMDALTHAIEAYIGQSNTKKTKQKALSAIKVIFANLETAVTEPRNIDARKAMQLASYDAGVAFTRAYVGNVHALSHPLSALYGLGHGETNGIILPTVLRYYGRTATKKLAKIAIKVGLVEQNIPTSDAAESLITKIEKMNAMFKIPKTIPVIKSEDIPLLVTYAYKEANPLYPVPKILSKKEMTNLYKIVGGENDAAKN